MNLKLALISAAIFFVLSLFRGDTSPGKSCYKSLAPATRFDLDKRFRQLIQSEIKRPVDSPLDLESLREFIRHFDALPPEKQNRLCLRLWNAAQADFPREGMNNLTAISRRLKLKDPPPLYAVYLTVSLDLTFDLEPSNNGLAARQAIQNPGGGALLVAQTLNAFGYSVQRFIPTSSLPIGKTYETFLRNQEREPAAFHLTPLQEDIRLCPSFVGRDKNGNDFEFRLVTSVPIIHSGEHENFSKKLEKHLFGSKKEGGFLITGGRIYPGTDVGFFTHLIERANRKGIKVFFDLHRNFTPEQREAVFRAKPYFLKTNLTEIANTFAMSEEELLENPSLIIEKTREQILSKGVSLVAVTLGDNGALLITPDVTYQAIAPVVPFVSSVGAGDAFVAGFLHQLIEGRSLPNALRFAIASGSCSTSKPGSQTASLQEVNSLSDQVQVSILDKPLLSARKMTAYQFEGFSICLQQSQDLEICSYSITDFEGNLLLSGDPHHLVIHQKEPYQQELLNRALRVFWVVPDMKGIKALLNIIRQAPNEELRRAAVAVLNERIQPLTLENRLDELEESPVPRQALSWGPLKEGGREIEIIFKSPDKGFSKLKARYLPDEKTISQIALEYPETPWSNRNITFHPVLGFHLSAGKKGLPHITLIVKDKDFPSFPEELYQGDTGTLSWQVLPLSTALLQDIRFADVLYTQCRQLPVPRHLFYKFFWESPREINLSL